jgi:hypothetical protein
MQVLMRFTANTGKSSPINAQSDLPAEAIGIDLR